jgi:D-xylose transport system substrate-binding protein
VQFTSPGGNDMTSIFLVPTPVTQENLQAVIDGNVTTQEELCQGVEAGAVAACP